jgi:transposase
MAGTASRSWRCSPSPAAQSAHRGPATGQRTERRAEHDVNRHPDPAQGRQIAERVVTSIPSCPVPEVARLGRTLKQWRQAFLAYFTTGLSSNGGTEAINGLIELRRRVARGFRNRNNYRLRMLLVGGGSGAPTSSKKSRNTA